MAAASGKPTVSLDPPWLKEPKPRVASTIPHESTVQAEIIVYLRTRDDIGCVVRLNSGTMSEGGRFVRMNTIYEPPQYEYAGEKIYPHMADVQAMHKPSGRLIAIEVKRPGWKSPKDKREFGQALYLNYVRQAGGIGIFATCLLDVVNVLPVL